MSDKGSAEQPKVEQKVEETVKDEKKEETETKAKGPTLFDLLGRDENKNVLHVFILITILLIVVSFGSFFILRSVIPMIWPNVMRKDANVYACGISAVFAHLLILLFGIWAKKYDAAEEEKEKNGKHLKKE